MPTVARVVPDKTVLFMCDLQTRFRDVIYGFEHLVVTANKMLKIAKILNIPIFVTEQNPTKLGRTVPELADVIAGLDALNKGIVAKTTFSMITPEQEAIEVLKATNAVSVVIFGLESHVCVLQTALDLVERGYQVNVLADGISSANKEEVPYAIERMRQAGVQVTTSESMIFQLLVDSANPNFRACAAVIKEENRKTESTLQYLLPCGH